MLNIQLSFERQTRATDGRNVKAVPLMLGAESAPVSTEAAVGELRPGLSRLSLKKGPGYRQWDCGSSVVTLKAAIRGHFKTGHRDWPET